MTLVRCCSRVKSAASAVTAAEIAPGALQHAAGDDPVHVRRPSRDKAAKRENQQPDDDDQLAPEDIGRNAIRNLENGLRQAVGA